MECDIIVSRSFRQHQQPSATLDPTHNLPFNLSLTKAQQHSRAQVPLPYAHEGLHVSLLTLHYLKYSDTGQPEDNSGAGGAIYYDPDSADDIDEDDPDEDLDI